MQKIRCKKCGRELRDPESIARGMGQECAGITGRHQKMYCSSQRFRPDPKYLQATGASTSLTLSTLIEKEEQVVEDIMVVEKVEMSCDLSEHRRQFPTELVDLVLSAPASGAIASRLQMRSGRKKKQPQPVNPGKTLKEIRRMCIEIRLSFWPGLLHNGQPVICVPYGEDSWKFENSERILSRAELEAYLTRYRMISPV